MSNRVYLVEDDGDRRAFLQRLLAALEEQSRYKWQSGFPNESDICWRNGHAIVKAIRDPDGVILLDFDLDDKNDGTNENTIQILETEFSHLLGYQFFKCSAPYQEILNQGGAKSRVSALIFAASLALNRHVHIVSRHGFARGIASELRFGHGDFPRYVEDNDPQKKKEYEDRVIGRIAADILNLVSHSEYNAAGRQIIQWAQQRGGVYFSTKVFGQQLSFHELDNWLRADEEIIANRPDKLTDEQVAHEAARLLESCGCGLHQIDFVSAIKMLKGFHRNQNHLALPIVRILAGSKVSSRPGDPIEISNWLVCKGNAGRTALAIYRLMSSEVDDPLLTLTKRMNVSLKSGRKLAHQLPRYVLKYEAEFVPRDRRRMGDPEVLRVATKQAQGAREVLEASPRQRMLKESRPNPGKATEACFWLREAAVKCSMQIAPSNPRKLVMNFEFESLGAGA